MRSPTNPAHPATCGVLFSGGADSAVLASRLAADGFRIQPIYVKCGLFWEPVELAWARRYWSQVRQSSPPLVVLDASIQSVSPNHWSITGEGAPKAGGPDSEVFLPGRNAILTLTGALWCQTRGIGQLCIGTLGTSPFADASPRFFQLLQELLVSSGVEGVRLRQPFAGQDKTDLVRWGATLPLELTFSCISPRDGTPCRRCNKCEERRQAFATLGRTDPFAAGASAPPRAAGTVTSTLVE